MKLNEFLQYMNDPNLYISAQSIGEEFIKKGYEKFLLLTFEEQMGYRDLTESEIKRRGLSLDIFNKSGAWKWNTIEQINMEYPDTFKLFFRYRPKKNYYIAREIANRAHKHLILDNFFPDDSSINHVAIFTLDQLCDALLLNITIATSGLREGLYGYDIYGVNLSDITSFCTLNNHPLVYPYPDDLVHFCGCHLRKDNNLFTIMQAREVIDELMKTGQFETEFDLALYLRTTYMVPIHSEYKKFIDYIRNHWDEITGKQNIQDIQEEKNRIYQQLKEEKERIYQRLLLENQAPIKWKSELALFKLISKYFPDARFQYRPKWLQPQSYDVFVPSINTAFEYQGIQHFKPVDFFGGAEAYKRRVELDQRKKKLSVENGVNLVEWRFEEGITQINLRKKLHEIGVPFPQ